MLTCLASVFLIMSWMHGTGEKLFNKTPDVSARKLLSNLKGLDSLGCFSVMCLSQCAGHEPLWLWEHHP